MSNWERRPLRQSQIHYGALDAYVLNQCMLNLKQIESFKDFEVEKYVMCISNKER